MIEIATKILDALCLLISLLRPGGSYGLVAEVLLLRQQLLVLKRERKKCPPLTTTDRLIELTHVYLYFSDDAEVNWAVSDSSCRFDFAEFP